jgi:hypothetical protein
MRPILLAAIAAALVLVVPAHARSHTDGRKNQKAEKSGAKSGQRSSTTKWDASVSGGGRMPDGPMRIAFGPGTTSASLIGEVDMGERRAYLLAGKSGQSITLRILGPRGARPSFEVASPGATALPSPVSRKVYDGTDRPHTSTWVLEADGDYVIMVSVLDERVTRFTLTVDVR